MSRIMSRVTCPGLYARDFMRGYPESLFRGSTVSPAQVPDVKFQAHGYLFLARNSLLPPRISEIMFPN